MSRRVVGGGRAAEVLAEVAGRTLVSSTYEMCVGGVVGSGIESDEKSNFIQRFFEENFYRRERRYYRSNLKVGNREVCPLKQTDLVHYTHNGCGGSDTVVRKLLFIE